jgi:SAM-dependent methyltransferase
VTAATDRLASEQLFHDAQARQRANYFARAPQELLVNEVDYLNHASWIGPAMAQLGNVRGQRVLDLGCGHGMATVVLARRGANVTACDLSGAYLAEAALRARTNGVLIDCIQLNGDMLPFADQSFDRVWGNAILHHLDIAAAGREIRRILAPAGRAVLCEPWGGNPLLRAARRWLPYPGKHRTPDERPLQQQDIHILRSIFQRVDMRGFQLIAMLHRLIPRSGRVSCLERVDRRLLTSFPSLEHFCRYIVLTLHP